MRGGKILRIILIAVACFFSFLFTSSANDIEEVDLNLEENEIAFTFFDLPNGEATLIQNTEHNVLINAGHENSRDALAERLEIYGVETIDKLILTNGSEAYSGNSEWLVNQYNVRRIISSQSIFMGTANKEVEKQLLEQHTVDAEILKVGGFGSNEGTIPEFLEKVDPQTAILFHKEGLLPSDQMIERLKEVWIDVYEMNQVGTVTIKLNHDSYEVITIPS
jgi:competence protein ComEC